MNKGRVTLSTPVVLENGRTLSSKTVYNHMFDGHLYVPVPGSEDALGAFRFFNSGDPLETPYTYFVAAQASTAPLSPCAQLTLSSSFEPLQVASMPQSLPSEAKDLKIVSDGLQLSDYKLIGDFKSLTPFGRVIPESDDDTDTVNPCVPAYVFACGAADRVQASADRISFKMFVEQYMNPLQAKAAIGVMCTIDVSLPRWSFLKDAKKRSSFIRQGSYVAVEGALSGLEIVSEGQYKGVSLEVRVEDVTLLGRAPLPSVETIEISDTDSPLRGKGKATLPSTPLKFSFSGLPSSQSSLGKRSRTEDSAFDASAERPSRTQPVSSSSSKAI